MQQTLIKITAGKVELEGILNLPASSRAIIIFAHGSGSGRLSPRNAFVSDILERAGFGSLLFDLLTDKEEKEDALTGALRFDIPFLSDRLKAATDFVMKDPDTRNHMLGYFGASTGAAAALVASTIYPGSVKAVVSRGGRPDLAGNALPKVSAPTLFIVGGNDLVVIDLNKKAFEKLNCEKNMAIVPGAGHLFEEKGTLDKAAELARDWFKRFLV